MQDVQTNPSRALSIAEIVAKLCKDAPTFNQSTGINTIIAYLASTLMDPRRCERLSEKGLETYLAVIYYGITGNSDLCGLV